MSDRGGTTASIFALAALLLTAGEADAASATAALNVSMTIEARCVVASTDTRSVAVHCTDSTPYEVLFDGRQSNSGALPPTGAKFLEITF